LQCVAVSCSVLDELQRKQILIDEERIERLEMLVVL